MRGPALLAALLLLCAAGAVREFDLGIAKRRLEGGASTIRVTRGDTVLLRWRTDEPVHLHLHGYDLEARPTPSEPARMRFEAGVAGRFPVTAHGFGPQPPPVTPPAKHREATLLYLEVLPE